MPPSRQHRSMPKWQRLAPCRVAGLNHTQRSGFRRCHEHPCFSNLASKFDEHIGIPNYQMLQRCKRTSMDFQVCHQASPVGLSRLLQLEPKQLQESDFFKKSMLSKGGFARVVWWSYNILLRGFWTGIDGIGGFSSQTCPHVRTLHNSLLLRG